MVEEVGSGRVGQFAVYSALLQGAGLVLAVDGEPSRLDAARRQGAETIDFNPEDPVEVLRELTGGSGPDRVIDAVGINAQRPKTGPAAEQAEQLAGQFAKELEQVAPETDPQGGDTWVPGDAPPRPSSQSPRPHPPPPPPTHLSVRR